MSLNTGIAINEAKHIIPVTACLLMTIPLWSPPATWTLFSFPFSAGCSRACLSIISVVEFAVLHFGVMTMCSVSGKEENAYLQKVPYLPLSCLYREISGEFHQILSSYFFIFFRCNNPDDRDSEQTTGVREKKNATIQSISK